MMRISGKTSYKISLLVTTALSLLMLSALASAKLVTGTDETAQLPFWEWRSDTISIRLVQRLPDQSRAYFTARGFKGEHAEIIAQSCVFQTVFKNIAKAGSGLIIQYDLSKWVIDSSGARKHLKLRKEWLKQWEQLKVVTKAKIAFKWSLLPTNQSYKAQDFNWGMTVYGLKPGEKFNLTLVWTENGNEKQAEIKNMKCAPDVHLEPKDPFG